MQLRKMAVIAALGAATLFMTGCGDDDEEALSCTTDLDCTGEETRCLPDPADTASSICQCELSGTSCGDGRVCDDTTRQCVDEGDAPAPQSCNPANQPGDCGYGRICSGGTAGTSSGTCQGAPVGQCSEATGAGAPVWNQNVAEAPVIVSATVQAAASTNGLNECAPNVAGTPPTATNGAPAGIVTITFYDPGGLTYSSATNFLERIRFRTLNSGQFFPAAFLRGTRPASGATTGTFTVGIGCGNATETVALHLEGQGGEDGNLVCLAW